MHTGPAPPRLSPENEPRSRLENRLTRLCVNMFSKRKLAPEIGIPTRTASRSQHANHTVFACSAIYTHDVTGAGHERSPSASLFNHASMTRFVARHCRALHRRQRRREAFDHDFTVAAMPSSVRMRAGRAFSSDSIARRPWISILT